MKLGWLLVAALVLGCGTSSGTPDAGGADVVTTLPQGCAAVDASACIDPPPSYANDVAPLLDRACNSTCHAPGVGPWPLNNWSDVSDWASIIQSDVQVCAMPPPDAGAGNGNLSTSEREMLLDWIACGAPNN